MKRIRRSRKFKVDFKKVNMSAELKALFVDTVTKLATGKKLHERLQDHALTSNWRAHRELHLKPDLLLVYRIVDGEVRLIRLGSHSNIF